MQHCMEGSIARETKKEKKKSKKRKKESKITLNDQAYLDGFNSWWNGMRPLLFKVALSSVICLSPSPHTVHVLNKLPLLMKNIMFKNVVVKLEI